MAGLPVVFRSETDGFRVSVRSAGEALRIRAADLTSAVAEWPEVHAIVLTSASRLLADVAQTAFCLSAHNTLQRLCRWLVHATDITGSVTIDVTHEDLTQVVGVARSAISQAMAELQTADAIWFHRGRVLIRSRGRLAASMCDCRHPPIASTDVAIRSRGQELLK
jgi:CRP-like cAMP-binding protein